MNNHQPIAGDGAVIHAASKLPRCVISRLPRLDALHRKLVWHALSITCINAQEGFANQLVFSLNYNQEELQLCKVRFHDVVFYRQLVVL